MTPSPFARFGPDVRAAASKAAAAAVVAALRSLTPRTITPPPGAPRKERRPIAN